MQFILPRFSNRRPMKKTAARNPQAAVFSAITFKTVLYSRISAGAIRGVNRNPTFTLYKR